MKPEGLWVKAQISNSDNPLIACVRDLVSEGILKTFSIGFEPKKEQNVDGTNVISEWRLNEISIVTLPCNIDAEFALTKQLSNKSYEEMRDMVKKAVTPVVDPALAPDENKPPVDPAQPNKPDPTCPPNMDEMKGKLEDCMAEKIPVLIKEGKDHQQAIAIAMSMCTAEGKCSVELMTPEMFAKADELAKACATDPKAPDTAKAAGDTITTPIHQPSNDPTDFGNPFMEVLKTGIALLGRIAEQLKSIEMVLVKQGTEDINEETDPNAQPTQPAQPSEAMKRILEIQRKMSDTIKELQL
jgi:hypothetical protein